MGHCCVACGASVELPLGGKPARGDECDSCKADLHACRQCQFYDPSSYNECRESQAERVVDKEKGNFCDYFTFTDGSNAAKGADGKKDALKKLDDLFS